MDIQSQLDLIKRGVSEIISEEELLKKLKQARPLIIKAGFDPTAPDIHLGHTVLLRKLRHFQDLGHKVFFLIGDFTAMIGDPSGQSKTRPTLTREEIDKNARTYKEQIFKLLDKKKTEIVFNSSWFNKMEPAQILGLAKYSTVAQVLARADFSKRYQENKDISLLEFFYPLLQAYDSVYLKADVELGGTDQKFNLLFGRQLQQDFGQEQQAVIMTPLLEGLDGVNKMSKSLNNYVGINDEPSDMFGKIMSVSDELMIKYYELLTDEDLGNVKSSHPMEAKKRLAGLIVGQYCGNKKSEEARMEFEKIFQKGDFKEVEVSMGVVGADEIAFIELLDNTEINLKGLLNLKGKNDFRRLVAQGAVKVNSEKINDVNFLIKVDGSEYKIQAGPKRFAKICLRKAKEA
ncbi:MAG: tyrosine--tRNA ligase [Candidatus Omnitrophica bacterium CG11_big_fil_rev_8_21_14_0_20_42_13]|uniref:Tyrosine--tRNA ligase n=1 Tax=Candidatus Ghiorseimicrobium undicola TaxID=1974746 RepID=A0A2H0LX69_9BACT|nr:MAG: tyrosine--tRNA ligase [Candidatus Omnitrophica bacterium CG11_big_fil_rev_8_21_14_0_20_42_13]